MTVVQLIGLTKKQSSKMSELTRDWQVPDEVSLPKHRYLEFNLTTVGEILYYNDGIPGKLIGQSSIK